MVQLKPQRGIDMRGINRKLKIKIIEHYGTQADFAEVVGKDEAVVSKVIRGRRQLDPAEKQRWAAILRCEPEQLFQ
jgi:hypothetical protein